MYRTIALLALFSCASVQAESLQCTTISSVPLTISAPGSYCLTGDLAISSGTAINIQSDNVVLDLNGHTLSGPGGSASTTGIFSNMRRGVRVHNGTLRGFLNGVLIDDHNSPFTYGGVSSRHEVNDLRVEGAYTGISVVGSYSSVHHNIVIGSAQIGIFTATISGTGSGAVNVLANQVFNTGSTSAANPVYGISAGGMGSLIQDNVVANLRGPTNSAAIRTTATSNYVSHNRESDYDLAYSVYCANVTKLVDNFATTSNGIQGCTQPTASTYNTNF
jgi:hypothetical protein